MMNTAVQCIILLACITCASTITPNCRCVKTCKTVKYSLIADVEVYEPRPYCNRKEVIVILNDKTSRCLDPNEKFAKTVVQVMQLLKAARAKKMNNSRSKTPTASTDASTTASATESATAPDIVALTSS